MALRSFLVLLFPMPALTSCFLPDCQAVYYDDDDGDGFGVGQGVPKCPAAVDRNDVMVSGDCDDQDPNTFPGAPETCDGIDRDCDGELPLDVVDFDADGFSVCDGDCNDADPMVFPGARERCNAIDDDCDGAIESDLLALDQDDDGFTGCDGDCEDTNPLVNPGAKDLCNGIDDDCRDGADSLLDVFEPNDSAREAVFLGSGSALSEVVMGAFSSVDDPADWFEVEAVDKENVFLQFFAIDLVLEIQESDLEARVSLLDEAGQVLASDEAQGPYGVAFVSLEAPIGTDEAYTGIYRIEVTPLGGAPNCEARYTLLVDVSD
ncbi:MAG: putative metal-binding motif-containing protein [Myxococcota bacterium]